MRIRALAAVFFLISSAATATDERETLYGVWGTAAQCARAPIISGGTVLSEPYEISSEWLRHGRIWCRLTWFPTEAREDGFFTGARAQCGEDSVRDYMLGMVVSGENLTLRWDFRLVGPLARCSDS